MQELVYSTDESQETYWIMINSMAKLHTTRQGQGESDSNYYRRLTSQIEVTESVWGRLVPAKMKGKLTADQDAARNAYLARLFLRGLHKGHQESVNDLGKAYVDGRDEYPKDVESALAWITNRPDNAPRYKHNKSQHTTDKRGNDDDSNARNLSSFAQQEEQNDNKTDSHDEESQPTVRFSGTQRVFVPRRTLSGWKKQ